MKSSKVDFSTFEKNALGEKISLKAITGGWYKVTGTGSMDGYSLEDREYYTDNGNIFDHEECDVRADLE